MQLGRKPSADAVAEPALEQEFNALRKISESDP